MLSKTRSILIALLFLSLIPNTFFNGNFERSRALYEKGVRVLRKNPAKGELILLESLAADRTNPAPIMTLSSIYHESGRDGRARTLLEEGLRDDPKSAEMRHLYAIILLSLGERESAREQLEKCLRIHPNFAPAEETLRAL